MVLAVILAKETLFDRTTARLSQPATRWAGTAAAIELQPRTPSQRPPLDRPGSAVLLDVFRCWLPELLLIYVYFFLFF
ncbi:hypothetical protein QUA81_32755 [Microcoleus sp. F6_B4]